MEVTVGKLMDIIKENGLTRLDKVEIISSKAGWSTPDSVMVMQGCSDGCNRLVICHRGDDNKQED